MLKKAFYQQFLVLFSAFFIIDYVIDYKIRHLGVFYICNEYISFNFPLKLSFVYVFLFLFIFIIFFFIRNNFEYFKKNKGLILGLNLFLMGAILNILDRILYGCVVDYIHLSIIPFPFFNLADILISFGVILIIHNLLTD